MPNLPEEMEAKAWRKDIFAGGIAMEKEPRLSKAVMKELARQHREREMAPVHLLLLINNMCTQILTGLDGGKVINDVHVPRLFLPKKHERWAREQLARIIRWNAACLEKLGFFTNKISAGVWNTAQAKCRLIGEALKAFAGELSYDEAVIAQMIVAETAWRGVRIGKKDNSQEARYLSSTLDTFTRKFIDVEDRTDVAAFDAYMALAPILQGDEEVRNLDFSQEKQWSIT